MPRSERFCPDTVLVSTSGRIQQWLGAGENVAQSQAPDAKVPCSCLGDRVHRSVYDGLLCPAGNQVHWIRSRAADRRGDQQWQDHSYRIAAVAWILDRTTCKEWPDACAYECERDTRRSSHKSPLHSHPYSKEWKAVGRKAVRRY